jgi:hypothetical protein
MLDYLTFVSLRSHFVETNLISLGLSQFADFVCKLNPVVLYNGIFVVIRYLRYPLGYLL